MLSCGFVIGHYTRGQGDSTQHLGQFHLSLRHDGTVRGASRRKRPFSTLAFGTFRMPEFCLSSMRWVSAERENALQMLSEVMEKREALGLPKQVEFLSADAGYGTSEFVADLLDRGVSPHMPLLAGENDEKIPVYQRRTFNLVRARGRREKIRRAVARKRVRVLQGTSGYQVSQESRVQNENLFAEGKNEHGLDKALRISGRDDQRTFWISDASDSVPRSFDTELAVARATKYNRGDEASARITSRRHQYEEHISTEFL